MYLVLVDLATNASLCVSYDCCDYMVLNYGPSEPFAAEISPPSVWRGSCWDSSSDMTCSEVPPVFICDRRWVKEVGSFLWEKASGSSEATLFDGRFPSAGRFPLPPSVGFFWVFLGAVLVFFFRGVRGGICP